MPIDYTAKEAAPLLGISPGSVRAFIKRGTIAATKRGRDWFITQDEIDRYNRERRAPGSPKGRKLSDETKRKLSEKRKGDKNPMHGKKHDAETLARMCAIQQQQPRGEESASWKGGRVLDRNGYYMIYAPDHPHVVNRYVLEHRLVMEQVLGRYLTPEEEVHHKNGDITDNRPENLEVMTKGEHSRLHRLNPHIKRHRS